jgi:hypothetical protein
MRGLWALVLLLLATPAFAQAPVQHVPTELRATQVCSDSRPAAAAAGSASLTAPGGQFLYINQIEINASASTGAAGTLGTAASASSTNIPGTITLGVFPIQAQAAGASIGNFFYALSGNGIKTNASGTATTITTPAIANVAWHIALCGYYAP